MEDYTDFLSEIINNQQSTILLLEQRFNNLEHGFQILLYVAIAFLLWHVIKAVYGLFGRVFFGGL